MPPAKGKLPDPPPETGPDLDEDGQGDHPFEAEVEFQPVGEPEAIDRPQWESRDEALAWAVDNGKCANAKQAQDEWKMATASTLGVGARIAGKKNLNKVLDTFSILIG